jgi:beta-1,2-xylosyltransferase
MKAEIHFKNSTSNIEALPLVCDADHADARYKYRLDIDGYGWSSRFRKLLSSNSLIIKSTVYVSSSISLVDDVARMVVRKFIVVR